MYCYTVHGIDGWKVCCVGDREPAPALSLFKKQDCCIVGRKNTFRKKPASSTCGNANRVSNHLLSQRVCLYLVS